MIEYYVDIAQQLTDNATLKFMAQKKRIPKSRCHQEWGKNLSQNFSHFHQKVDNTCVSIKQKPEKFCHQKEF